jgi:hypothetical protein
MLPRDTKDHLKLKEVLPPALEGSARAGLRTRGAGLRRLEGIGLDDNDEFRSR